jgi:hypothetical protein
VEKPPSAAPTPVQAPPAATAVDRGVSTVTADELVDELPAPPVKTTVPAGEPPPGSPPSTAAAAADRRPAPAVETPPSTVPGGAGDTVTPAPPAGAAASPWPDFSRFPKPNIFAAPGAAGPSPAGPGPTGAGGGPAPVLIKDCRVQAEALFDGATAALTGVLGPEWQPRNENEREGVVVPLTRYAESKGGLPDLPPGWALAIAVGAYAMPRFRQEPTKTKLLQAWLTFKGWLGKFRRPRSAPPPPIGAVK